MSEGIERMEGMDLLHNLAELERKLKEKLDEAHGSAEARVASAEKEARRILADAEDQIHRMTEVAKAEVAEECEKILQESRKNAEAEAQRIRDQAASRISAAVDFVLSKVLP
jgi:vacuolar-type H+-ATPase subunit H